MCSCEKTKYIITYFLDTDDLDHSVELLLKTSDIVKAGFPDGINKVIFDDKNTINRIPFHQFSISKSVFKQVIADVSYIEDFEVEMATVHGERIKLWKKEGLSMWNAEIYNRYGKERIQPSIDLVARIKDMRFERILDVGCGTGMIWILFYNRENGYINILK